MAVKAAVSLGGQVADFTESFVRHTRGEFAGELVELRPFQRAILDGLFELNDDGLWKHRQAMVILPRKAGKSLLLSGVATYALFALASLAARCTPSRPQRIRPGSCSR